MVLDKLQQFYKDRSPDSVDDPYAIIRSILMI